VSTCFTAGGQVTLKPQVVYPICASTKLRNRSGWNGGNGCRGAAAVVDEVDVTLLIVIARVLTKKEGRLSKIPSSSPKPRGETHPGKQ
jgi:hypothetical protein